MSVIDKKKILQEEEYGYLPTKPTSMKAKIVSIDTDNYFAGKANNERIDLTFIVNNKKVTFPINFVYHRNQKNVKTVIVLNFFDGVPNRYFPAEEIIDLGWNAVTVNYNDITSDKALIDGNGHYMSFPKDNNYKILRGKESKTAPGKIMMWAWGAMRILDYLLTRKEVDKKNVAIVGHSRLGKTALVAGAFDSRFAFVHSNCSGTCGANLFRYNSENAEHIDELNNMFGYWMCDNFRQYSKNNLPKFDQDILLSLVYPRVLSVASAVEDLWANPKGEFECLKLASKAWGKNIKFPKEAKLGKNYHNYKVGYYMRKGRHFFSREDFNRVLKYFDKNLN